MRYYAHIREDGKKQTVAEHLTQTAEMAADFAKKFDAEEQGYLAGITHDLGKYSEGFQKRLLGGDRVDHATAGAQTCARLRQIPAAFCVAGHHTGLLNMGSRTDTAQDATMMGRIKKQVEDYSAFQEELTLPKASFPPYFGKSPLSDSFFIRMLFSALKDADFLDTEAFMTGERNPQYDSIPALWDKLWKVIQNWFPGNTELNQCRCEILDACIQQGESTNPGLFSLTVPTGGGKTVASMAFALKHAIRNQKDRIIYVIPYTSIIEQTAGKYREIFGETNVLEHHSGVNITEDDCLTPEKRYQLQATENWDMPIVVTTAVQFFESLYSNKTSRCRKLHNIANSVIIFDEAQMMPVPYLRPCVYAITELVKHYHATAVLCTATQPALETLIRDFFPEAAVREICPRDLAENSIFERTLIQKTGILSWEEIAAKMNELQQALTIVNSRKAAQTVFENLDTDGKYHLSTLMCPVHRRSVLDEIRQKLKNGELCRVVSTSLIEAGVDVDFPKVFREEAGLDSVIQAAGRCNREAKRSKTESVVTVFTPETPAPPIFAIPIGAARVTEKCTRT